MDVASPITTVIPSLDGPVFHALAASNTPSSLTQIHQRAGRGSLSGVRRVLQRMVEHGLVDVGPAGYSLNREHVAAPAVLLLTMLHGELAARLRNWLEDRPEDVVAAGLFGSAARRDGDVTSDVDVVVVTGSVAEPDLGDELAEVIQRWTGNRGHVVQLSRDEARRLRDEVRPIVASWQSELQMVLGDRREVVG